MIFAVFDGYDSMSQYACDHYVDFISSRELCVLGLATGSTPELFYEKLADSCKRGEVSFKDVETFNLDEYCGIDASNDQSYLSFMKRHLFDKVDIPKGAWHLPDGNASDPKAACHGYDEAIFDAGGIDLQLLGLGNNGHIGFNEPSDSFPVGTHIVDLDSSTIEANSRFFESMDDVPKRAITMGIGTIMCAQSIVVMATGRGKAGIVKRAFTGKVVPQVPASVLQLHRDVLVLLDKDAAAELVPALKGDARLFLYDDLSDTDF